MEEDPIGANKKRVFEKMSQVQLEARRMCTGGENKRFKLQQPFLVSLGSSFFMTLSSRNKFC